MSLEERLENDHFSKNVRFRPTFEKHHIEILLLVFLSLLVGLKKKVVVHAYKSL